MIIPVRTMLLIIAMACALAQNSNASAIFEFVGESEFDNGAGTGATMTRSGITVTTRGIVGSDATTDGNTLNILDTLNSLGINTASVSGGESQQFDAGEAWIFDFDVAVNFERIYFTSLNVGDSIRITLFDGSNGGAGTVLNASPATVDLFDFAIGRMVPAGTEIRIEQRAGSSRIVSFTVSSGGSVDR